MDGAGEGHGFAQDADRVHLLAPKGERAVRIMSVLLDRIRSFFVDIWNEVSYIVYRTVVRVSIGHERRMNMTENEKELINLIRASGNPERALAAAVELITEYLKQPGSSQ